MAVKTFTTGEVLTAADTNTFLANSGLVYITSGALSTASTDFVGCFSSTYDNYLVVLDSLNVNTTTNVYYQLLSGTTPLTTGYDWAYLGLNVAGTASNASNSGFAYGFLGFDIGVTNQVLASTSFQIFCPFKTSRTWTTGSGYSYFSTGWGMRTGGSHNDTLASYNGIKITTGGAPTLTGTATIYGYRKA